MKSGLFVGKVAFSLLAMEMLTSGASRHLEVGKSRQNL